jgi:hypothetical protein
MTLILNKSYADSSNELEKTKQEFGSMPIFLYVTNKIGLGSLSHMIKMRRGKYEFAGELILRHFNRSTLILGAMYLVYIYFLTRFNTKIDWI